MNVITTLLLLVSSAAARADDTAPAVTPAPAPVYVDEIMRLAPQDAALVLYTADIEGLLSHPILSETPAGLRSVAALLLSQKDAFGGPTMLAVSGVPVNPMSWRVTAAARVALTPDALFDLIETQIVPTWNRSESTPGDMQFWREAAVGHLVLVGPIPVTLDIASRRGVMYATSIPGGAAAWLQGAPSEPSFVEGDDYARLDADTTGRLTELAYLDLRSLIPMAQAPLGAALPELYSALQLDRLEFVGLIGTATDRPGSDARRQGDRKAKGAAQGAQRAVPESAPEHRQRLVVGLSNLEQGLWHAAASTPSDVTLAEYFPAATTLLVHGSMKDATAIADDVSAFATAIDPAIVEEYRQEVSEWREELGFDFHSEFLANLVREWAIGGEVGPDTEPMLAVRLGSAATFTAQLHRLRMAYQLETTPDSHRGIAIEHAQRHNGTFSFAVVGDVLLVAATGDLLNSAIDAYMDKTGLARTKAYDEARRSLAGSSSKFVFVNIAAMLDVARQTGEADDMPAVFERLSTARALAIAVRPRDRAIAVDFAVTGDNVPGPANVLATMLIPSFEAARRQSMRAVSMSNVKGILTSCMIYAQNNEKQWPRTLRELLASGTLGDPAQAARMLSNPYEPGEPSTKPYYLYRPLPDPQAVKEPWTQVVISEPGLHDGGAVFGYLDGHVGWITSPEADELLKAVQSGK